MCRRVWCGRQEALYTGKHGSRCQYAGNHAVHTGGYGAGTAFCNIPTVIYRAVSHVRTFGSHLCDYQRTYGGDLSDGQSGTAPICNLWKQGTEHDGPELYEKSVCTGISGIFDHGMCGNLCSPDPVSSIQHRYHCFVMEGYGLYDPAGIYLI